MIALRGWAFNTTRRGELFEDMITFRAQVTKRGAFLLAEGFLDGYDVYTQCYLSGLKCCSFSRILNSTQVLVILICEELKFWLFWYAHFEKVERIVLWYQIFFVVFFYIFFHDFDSVKLISLDQKIKEIVCLSMYTSVSSIQNFKTNWYTFLYARSRISDMAMFLFFFIELLWKANSTPA